MGGVPCAINLDETGAVGAVNMERLNLVSSIIQKARQFCEQVYLPDVLLIASYYKDWAKIGGGLSSMNLLAYGEFPDNPNDYSASNLLLPRGAIINGRFDEIHPVDLTAPMRFRSLSLTPGIPMVTAITIRACIRGMV